MVIGLLTLGSIPTVTGISLGISERNKPETMKKERERMKKFTLTCWCEGRSRGKSVIHGGHIVLGEGKMWIQSRRVQPKQPFYPFDGFYIDYPDTERPPPPPTGLCTMVSDDPPLMNWIYIDKDTWEVRHGNRTQSIKHWVGNFGWTSEDDDDFDTDPGGLVFEKEELFVAVEPRKGSKEAEEGRWEVFWDRKDNRLEEVESVKGRTVLRISLERAIIEEEKVLEQAQQGQSTGQSNQQPSESSKANAAQQQASNRAVRGQPVPQNDAQQVGKSRSSA